MTAIEDRHADSVASEGVLPDAPVGLVRLDAAQARTQTFYDALDTQQKTIFDLFWTVMHHRFAGQEGWQMPMHMSAPSQP